MIELFIEGQSADINVGFSSMLNYAIDDIKEFGTKNTSFSKTIILPGTKRNNDLLGNVFSINRTTQYNPTVANIGVNYNAAIGAKALIFSNNIQVFKGVLRLMEIIITDGVPEYEVAVFGELGGFISALGNKRLEDLDFSAYNMNYTLANIVSSWSATPGTGVYFPLIDYGTYSTNKHDWSYRTFRPALHDAEYLTKIFSSAGYTVDFPLMETARFKNLITPHNQKRLTRMSSNFLSVEFDGSGTTDENGPFHPAPFVGINLGDFVIQPNGVGDQELKFTGAASLTGTLIINASYSFSGGASVALRFYRNGTILASRTTSGNLNYTNTAFTINPNDTLSIVCFVTNADTGGTGNFADVSLSGTINFDGNKPELVLVNLGEPIVINDTIPRNVFQRDFFSSIVKLFNLYVYEDQFTAKKLRISPFVDFYNADPITFEDWTDKVDLNKPLRIKPMSELNARYYEFNFKNDSDFYNDQYQKRYNENYGGRIFDSAFEFAKETEKLEVIFSGTPLIGYSSEGKVYSTILKSSAGVEETIDSNIRILQRKLITGVGSWAIKDEATTLATYTNYPYAGHFDDPDAPTNDIQFGVPKELFFVLLTGAINVNQFNVYYSAYMAEITDVDSKLLSATLKLTQKDIYNLDFSKFKWINGTLYRLNKIEDYNATNEDTCKAELIKVLNTIY